MKSNKCMEENPEKKFYLPKKWCVLSSQNCPFVRNIFCQNFQKIFLLNGFLDIWFGEPTGMVESTLSLVRQYLIYINIYKPDKSEIRSLTMKKKNQYFHWNEFDDFCVLQLVSITSLEISSFLQSFILFSVCDDLSWLVWAIPWILSLNHNELTTFYM